jgi:D-alanyl-D-alanine carboxypeptidase
MVNNLQTTVLVFLALFFGEAFAFAQKIDVQDLKKIHSQCQSILETLHQNGDFPGASASIVLPDDQMLSICVGTAFDSARTPITAKSRMSSGSVGKTYFAALAMRLVSENKLDRDANVSVYLGDQQWFSRIPNKDEITIRNLLCHQSGIPRYVLEADVWKTAIDNPEKQWHGIEQLGYVFDKKPLHKAGDGWAYSDTNYILLALVLEKVSQRPAIEQIDEYFLKPNKLNDTVPATRGKIENLVSGRCRLLASYGIPEQPVVDNQFVFNPEFEWAGGGYVCTSADLARWTRILWSGKALQGNYVQTMVANAPSSAPFLGRGSKYGIGTMIRPTPMGESFGHDGVFTGYLTSTAYFPDHDIAVAIQVTTDRARDIGKPLHRVVSQLAETVSKHIAK